MVTLRPSVHTKTGRVWKLADEITGRVGRLATRREVVDSYVREGGNPNTASTQYQYWQEEARKSGEVAKPLSAGIAMPQQAVRRDGRYELQIGADGRVLIPIELRDAMDIGADRILIARIEDGALRLVSPRTALRQLQDLVRRTDKGKGSAVDDLLADRRLESAKP